MSCQSPFAGIRVGVSALVFYSVLKMINKNAKTPIKFAIFLLTFIAIGFLQISPVIIVIAVGVFGILIGRMGKNA